MRDDHLPKNPRREGCDEFQDELMEKMMQESLLSTQTALRNAAMEIAAHRDSKLICHGISEDYLLLEREGDFFAVLATPYPADDDIELNTERYILTTIRLQGVNSTNIDTLKESRTEFCKAPYFNGNLGGLLETRPYDVLKNIWDSQGEAQ